MKISDFVYHPQPGSLKFDKTKCAFLISSYEDHNGRFVRQHQCQHPATKEDIGGWFFCKGHAWEVKQELSKADGKH